MEPVKKTRRIPLLPILAGLMILIPILIVAGCTGKPPLPSDTSLNGTGWTLTGYTDNGSSRQPLNGTTITLLFSNAGQITGSAGCNHYAAGYGLNGTTITFGQAGSTEMYCTAPGVMEQENTYLSLLGRAASVSAGSERLIFADAQGNPLLSFARIIPPAPAPLTGTTWTLDSFYSADAVSSVISGTTITAVFGEDGNLAGSAGCNRYFASYNVTGTSMVISSTGSTKMYCSGDGVMQQESAYLGSLGRVVTYTVTGDRLSLADDKGAALLSFTKEH